MVLSSNKHILTYEDASALPPRNCSANLYETTNIVVGQFVPCGRTNSPTESKLYNK
jgi:hypothetical protein